MNTNELKDLYTKSCNLISPYIYLEGEIPIKNAESQEGQTALNEGIEGFKLVLEEAEENWAAWWFLGKAYQCTNNHEDAYDSFLKAYRNNLEHQDIIRELALECLMTSRFTSAAYYCNVAIEFDPSDCTLWSNMSVAHLFNNKIDKAEYWAKKTLEKIPDDKPAATVLKFTEGINNGTMVLPDKFSLFQ